MNEITYTYVEKILYICFFAFQKILNWKNTDKKTALPEIETSYFCIFNSYSYKIILLNHNFF